MTGYLPWAPEWNGNRPEGAVLPASLRTTPSMESDASVSQQCAEVATSWWIGQHGPEACGSVAIIGLPVPRGL